MAVRSYNSPRKSQGRRSSPSVSWRSVTIGAVVVVFLFLPLFLKAIGGSGTKTPDSTNENAYPPQLVSGEKFAPTEGGAVAFATKFEGDYLTADLDVDQSVRDELLARTSESFAAAMDARLGDLFEIAEGNPILDAQSRGVRNIARTWPVTYKVDDFATGRSAKVTIWSCTIAGVEGIAAPRISWVRNQITVERQGDQWKVSDYRTLRPIVPRISATLKATGENTFYGAQEGAEFYDQAP